MKYPLLVLAVLPVLGTADLRDDYAWQWPVEPVEPDRAAYQVVLDETVYAAVRQPGLGDIQVMAPDGTALPTAVLAADELRDNRPETLSLPWYRVPPPAPETSNRWRLKARTDASGRVLDVETEITGEGTDIPPATDILIDISQVERPIRALILDWPGDAGDLNRSFAVETSPDLVDWRVRIARTRILDLTRSDRRLTRNRLELGGLHADYLRLRPLDRPEPMPLTGITAEFAEASEQADWQWLALTGRIVNGEPGTTVEYELPGRFPVARVDIEPGPGESARWQVFSRDDPDASWRRRAGPRVAFHVAGPSGQRSAPASLGRLVRNRYWRLTTPARIESAPVLRIGYRPETVVFLPRGDGPFTLVAGSARARRESMPLREPLDALRERHGPGWQPGATRLGGRTDLAGEAALEPAAVRPDWKSWILWLVLTAGAVLVAVMAVIILRSAARE